MESVILNRTKFQISETTKERLVMVIRWLCMALFVYTAYAKIVDHARFLNGLSHVHIVSGYAVLVSFFVPITEILIALCLLIPRTAKIGLYGFATVMIIFTVYILAAIIWERNLPCHCGGAIESLSWSQHIWFNLAFISIAILALRLNHLITSYKNKTNEKF